MKKLLITLLLSITYIGLYAQCSILPSGGTVKAKAYKSCYDTVTVKSTLNTLDADTCSFTQIQISGTGSNVLKTTNNLSDLTNAGTARTNLGLGTLATQSGTFSGTSSGTNTGDQTNITGNAATATALLNSRTINGTPFDGTANITITAAASTLTGTTLASGVTASSLTSFGSSPIFTTPLLGTPTSGVLTNCTGLPSTSITGLGSGIYTWWTTPSSANLAAALTDETGSGSAVFATSPTLVTPNIGSATGTSLIVTGGVSMGALTTGYTAKTTTYSILTTDNTIDCTSGTFTATLPTAISVTGQEYTITNSGTGTITLATTSSQTISGYTTRILSAQYSWIRVKSNGSNWIITGASN